jgi:uncharacterized protein
MEFFVYITYDCNLDCSFCYAKSFLKKSKKSVLSDVKIDKLVEYIFSNRSGQDMIVFFGGEPLLEYKIIDKIVKKTNGFNLQYAVYTNGLLLDRVPLEVLNCLDVIFVSIDGDKKAQELYKGAGTYDKVINNLELIRPKTESLILGRITVDEATNIYDSVVGLLNYTDAIHWQIVNKPSFENKELFIGKYKENIKKLFEYWLSKFRVGEILRIVPFQAIISSLIFNYKNNNKSFRCNVGSDLQTIDVDGNIYWCDECIGDGSEIVGNIFNNERVNLLYKSHKEIFEDCKKCEVSDICLGRCKKCLLKCSDEQKRVYCELTIFLIKLILSHIDEIKDVVERNNYTFEDFFSGPYYTEEIP